MALTGYSSGAGNAFQAPVASLSPDATVCDGDVTTGPTLTSSPPAQMTAAVDQGSANPYTAITVTREWIYNLTEVLETSPNSTGPWNNVPLPATTNHGGVLSSETVTAQVSGTDRWFRYSAADDGNGGTTSGEVGILEIQPAGPVDAVYSLVSDTTGTLDALPNFANSGGVVSAKVGAGSVCIRMDLGSVQTVTELLGAVGYSYTPSELWKWSTDDVTYHPFTPTLQNAYSPGGGAFTQVNQVWTPASPITARYFRFTLTDTGSGSQVATPGVITLAANAPAASGGGGLTLSGTVTGPSAPGPFSNSYVSIVYKTGSSFQIRNSLARNPNTQGRYCSDGDLQVAVVATDCSGSWTWTAPAGVVTAGIRSVKVYLGPMRINPNYSSEDLTGVDADGVPNGQYIVYDTSHREWAATAGTGFGGDASIGTTTIVSGSWNPGPGAQTTYSDCSGLGCCGGGVDFGLESYGAQTAVGYLLAEFKGAYSGCNSFTFVTGTFVFSTSLNLPARRVWLAIQDLFGKLYNLSDVPTLSGATPSAMIGDACGRSGPTTAFGTGASIFMPLNVDWWEITSVTAIDINTSYNCGNLQTLEGVPSDVIQIYPSNQLHSPVEHDRILAGTTNGATGTGQQGLLIIVKVCTPAAPNVQLQADAYEGILNVCWVTSSGALKQAAHLAPAAYIGNSAAGWQTTQIVESANVSACGLFYLPNGRLVMPYSLSNQSKRRWNDKRGTTTAADWSAIANFTIGSVSAYGRAQEQSWALIMGTADQAGQIQLVQARDNRAGAMTLPITALGGSTKGPLCGTAFMGSLYGILYTRFGDNEILWTTTPNPTNWVAGMVTTDTGFVGNVCGMARHPSGRLVALVQASPGGAVTALISNDRGLTWTQTAALGITPNPPPVIVGIGNILYAVYVQADAPRFCASVDGGLTWTCAGSPSPGLNFSKPADSMYVPIT